MTHVCVHVSHILCMWQWSDLYSERRRETNRQTETDRQADVLEFPFLKSTNQENKLKFSIDSRLSGIHTEFFKTVAIQGPTLCPTATSASQL